MRVFSPARRASEGRGPKQPVGIGANPVEGTTRQSIFATLLSWLCAAAGWSAEPAPPRPLAYPPELPDAEAIVYRRVGETDLKLYVFKPRGRAGEGTEKQRPAIVFFFGGGWQLGSPEQFAPHCRYLAARGMVAMAADYRVASRHSVKPIDCVTDAQAALTYVRDHADELGIDWQRVVAAGGSAGGHLAAATALLPTDDPKGVRPNALVLFNPVLVTAPIDGEELRGFARGWDAEKLGTEPEALSPLHHLREKAPPTIIFHGASDQTVPLDTVEAFRNKARDLGNRCVLVTYPGEDHGFFNFGRKRSGAFLDTLEKTDLFLASLGYLAGPPTVDAFFANQRAARTSPEYLEHQDLTYYLDEAGERRTIETPDDWQRRREQIVAGLERVMGPLPKPLRSVPLEMHELESVEVDDIVRKKISYQTDSPYRRVTAYLLMPAKCEGRLPAMLCLHQTTKMGKGEPAGLGGKANLHYAFELARRGYVTLAPDYPSFGDYVYDFPADDGYASGSMKAICDNRRAIDVLQSLPEVDPERIGCIGHSLGGHNSIFTAVFDERIKAVVSSCGFTRFHKYYGGKLKGWTSDRYMPRIASEFASDPDRVPFDFPELVATIAPRAFFTSSPTGDDNFEVSGVRDSLAAAAPIFKLLGAEDRLVAEYPECGHDFPPEVREKAYRFLDTQLKSP
jgi:acetyl esterase/lipase